ncbi:beta-lactamase-like protein [Phaeosphaeria sp. MPI-PUGE-AT-0046c]|nr:beta-lactamase-like protein [Phaeosphaeria sp. MPI-PUGE-AT-0046c]
MRSLGLRTALAVVLCLARQDTAAQFSINAVTNFSTWFNETDFPQAQTSNVTKYMAEAQQTSWPDLFQHFMIRCIDAQKYKPILEGLHPYGFIHPRRPFDSLFFVGQSEVSSWAIDTGKGLIVIDTLDNPEEVEAVLLPGLAHYGYTGHDIAAVLLTHEHSDHFGGAGYLQSTFGTPIWASDIAWSTIVKATGAPTKDQVLTDGHQLVIGNTSVSIVATPGHTPGCYSFIFPVYEAGKRHNAGFYCGGGIPSSAADKTSQALSFQKFAKASRHAGVDVLLSNHQDQDQSVQNFDILDVRSCDASGACAIPNPFVIGTDAYLRYLKVMELCVRTMGARLGQSLSA